MLRSLLLLAAVNLFAQGSSYQWIRQLGGSEQDVAIGMAVDSAGNTYVAGNTDSPDFPVKNAVQGRPGGSPLYRIDGATGGTRLYGTGVASIVGVTFSPCEAQTIYAVSPRSVLHSEDLGTTWNSAPLPEGNMPSSIAVACDQPSAPAIYVSTQSGLIRSRDLITWDTLTTGARSVSRVLVDPNVQTTVYARTPQGLARSTDAGASWQLTGVTTNDLTFDVRQPGTIYAPVINFIGNTFGVASIVPAKSTDFGVTWMQLAPVPGRDTYPQVVLPDPARAGVLYAAGFSGLFASSDSGQTWTAKPVAVSFPMVVDAETNTIYAISNAQVVATRDGFDTLTVVAPAALPFINSLAASHGVVFASNPSSRDVFVTKLNQDGEILFSTYFGGSADDTATAMALGGDGAVYVTGNSSSLDFPTTPGAFQPKTLSQGAKFVFKLNSDGSLAYSTYFSGTNNYNTSANALAVDSMGGVIIAGTTSGGIPTTPGGYQTEFKGIFVGGPGSIVPLPPPTNAFVTKFRPDGSALAYSTYLGTQNDTGNVLALAPDGSMYVGGNKMLFHLAADGSQLVSSVPVTGPSMTAIAVDGAGSLYVVAPDTSGGGSNLTWLKSDLQTSARQSLPGAYNAKLSFDAAGNLLVAGSATPVLQTLAPIQGAFSPQTGFVTLLTPDLSNTLFSTFSGDRHLFSIASAATAPDGSIVFAGSTRRSITFNSWYPFAPGPDDNGSTDVYVVKLAPRVPAVRLDSIENAASFIANPLAATETVIVRGKGFGDDATVLVDGELLTILSRTADSILATLPPGFKNSGSARVQVQSGDVQSNAVLMPASSGSPGVFAADGSGLGQGYILNADRTRNGPSNPAAEGEPITIFLTGGTPDLPVAVFVDGFYANGISATFGPVDGLPGSVYQVSVYVPKPSDLADQNPNLKNFKMPPTVSVQVMLGEVKSQNGITLSVK